MQESFCFGHSKGCTSKQHCSSFMVERALKLFKGVSRYEVSWELHFIMLAKCYSVAFGERVAAALDNWLQKIKEKISFLFLSSMLVKTYLYCNSTKLEKWGKSCCRKASTLIGRFRTLLLKGWIATAPASGLHSLSANVMGTTVTSPTFLSQNTRKSKTKNVKLEDATCLQEIQALAHFKTRDQYFFLAS